MERMLETLEDNLRGGHESLGVDKLSQLLEQWKEESSVIVRVLAGLSLNARCADEGSVRMVLKTMSNWSSHCAIQQNASLFLDAFLQARRDFVDKKLLQDILKSTLDTMESNIGAVQAPCCNILCNLAQQYSMRASVVQAGGHSLAVTAMRREQEDTRLQENVISLAATLAEDHSLIDDLVEVRLLEDVRLARNRFAGDEVVQKHCVRFFAHVACSKKVREPLMRDHIYLDICASMLECPTSRHVARYGCMALFRLLWENASFVPYIAQDNQLIQTLYCTMESFLDDALVQMNGCGTLSGLVMFCEKVYVQDALDRILAAVKKHPLHTGVQEYGCGALANLCSRLEDVIQFEAVRACVVQTTKQHSENEAVLAIAFGTLANLAEQNEVKMKLVQDGIVSCLKSAMGRFASHPLLQRNACGCVWKLAENGSCAASLFQSELHKNVLAATRNYQTNADILSLACAAIWKLAAENRDCRNALVEQGTLELILESMSTFPFHAELQQFGFAALESLFASKGNSSGNCWSSLHKVVHKAFMNHPSNQSVMLHACLLLAGSIENDAFPTRDWDLFDEACKAIVSCMQQDVESLRLMKEQIGLLATFSSLSDAHARKLSKILPFPSLATAMEVHVLCAELQIAACSLVQHIMPHLVDKEPVLRARIHLSVLRACSGHPSHALVQQRSMECLASLVQVPSLNDALVSNRLLEETLRTAENYKDSNSPVLECALDALEGAADANPKVVCTYLIQIGVFDLIEDLLSKQLADELVITRACRTLNAVIRTKEHARCLAANTKTLHSLVAAMCMHPGASSVQTCACDILGKVKDGEVSLPKRLVVERVLGSLRSCKDDVSVQIVGLKALNSGYCVTSDGTPELSEGLIEHVCQTLTCMKQDKEVKRQGLQLLALFAELIAMNQPRELLVICVETLAEILRCPLLSDEDQSLAIQAMLALKRLGESASDGSKLMLEVGIPSILVSIITHPQVTEDVLLPLLNLFDFCASVEDVDKLDVFVECCAHAEVLRIIELYGRGSPELLRHALSFLARLCVGHASRKALVDMGLQNRIWEEDVVNVAARELLALLWGLSLEVDAKKSLLAEENRVHAVLHHIAAEHVAGVRIVSPLCGLIHSLFLSPDALTWIGRRKACALLVNAMQTNPDTSSVQLLCSWALARSVVSSQDCKNIFDLGTHHLVAKNMDRWVVYREIHHAGLEILVRQARSKPLACAFFQQNIHLSVLRLMNRHSMDARLQHYSLRFFFLLVAHESKFVPDLVQAGLLNSLSKAMSEHVRHYNLQRVGVFLCCSLLVNMEEDVLPLLTRRLHQRVLVALHTHGADKTIQRCGSCFLWKLAIRSVNNKVDMYPRLREASEEADRAWSFIVRRFAIVAVLLFIQSSMYRSLFSSIATLAIRRSSRALFVSMLLSSALYIAHKWSVLPSLSSVHSVLLDLTDSLSFVNLTLEHYIQRLF